MRSDAKSLDSEGPGNWRDMDMVDFVLFKGLCQKLDGYMLNAIVMMMMVVATSPTEISSTSGSNRRE